MKQEEHNAAPEPQLNRSEQFHTVVDRVHLGEYPELNRELKDQEEIKDLVVDNDDGVSSWKRLKRFLASVFITLEIESSGPLAKSIGLVIRVIIVIAILNMVIASEPSLSVTPDKCSNPACNNDPTLCPGEMICESIDSGMSVTVEAFCIYIFTIEYGLRLLTCWTVSSKLAGVLPQKWIDRHPNEQPPVFPAYYQILRFIFLFRNLVDLACIVPYYVDNFGGYNAAGTGFVRVLRLLRLIRIIRVLNVITEMENIYVMTKLMEVTLMHCAPVLLVFLFFAFLAMIFFGCIIFIAETGTFTVNADYPSGAYLRPTIDQTGLEVSPFYSIAVSFYWVIVTGCTVGYGDIVATTVAGRAIASVVCIMGIMGIAFPVGVVGSEFTRVYNTYYATMKRDVEESRKAEAAMVADQINRSQKGPEYDNDQPSEENNNNTNGNNNSNSNNIEINKEKLKKKDRLSRKQVVVVKEKLKRLVAMRSRVDHLLDEIFNEANAIYSLIDESTGGTGAGVSCSSGLNAIGGISTAKSGKKKKGDSRRQDTERGGGDLTGCREGKDEVEDSNENWNIDNEDNNGKGEGDDDSDDDDDGSSDDSIEISRNLSSAAMRMTRQISQRLMSMPGMARNDSKKELKEQQTETDSGRGSQNTPGRRLSSNERRLSKTSSISRDAFSKKSAHAQNTEPAQVSRDLVNKSELTPAAKAQIAMLQQSPPPPPPPPAPTVPLSGSNLDVGSAVLSPSTRLGPGRGLPKADTSAPVTEQSAVVPVASVSSHQPANPKLINSTGNSSNSIARDTGNNNVTEMGNTASTVPYVVKPLQPATSPVVLAGTGLQNAPASPISSSSVIYDSFLRPLNDDNDGDGDEKIQGSNADNGDSTDDKDRALAIKPEVITRDMNITNNKSTVFGQMFPADDPEKGSVVSANANTESSGSGSSSADFMSRRYDL